MGFWSLLKRLFGGKSRTSFSLEGGSGKYDDATWYADATAGDLTPEECATHIALFLAWAIGRDLVGELHREVSADDLVQLQNRQITPGEFLSNCCDCKLTDEDLNEVGNQFASQYYEQYLEDFNEVFEGGEEVEDSWTNFDRLKPILDQRFDEWHKDGLK